MSKTLYTAAIAALAFFNTTGVWAQTGPATPGGDRVDNRQERQVDRIEHGVADGSLTRRETRHLAHQQAKTQKMEHRAEADGHVTRREALRLEHRQDRNSRAIARARHDRQERH
jgi:hypothetical protein